MQKFSYAEHVAVIFDASGHKSFETRFYLFFRGPQNFGTDDVVGLYVVGVENFLSALHLRRGFEIYRKLRRAVFDFKFYTAVGFSQSYGLMHSVGFALGDGKAYFVFYNIECKRLPFVQNTRKPAVGKYRRLTRGKLHFALL